MVGCAAGGGAEERVDAYLPDDTGACRGYGIMVLTLAGEQIATITGFPSTHVFEVFGLPPRPETEEGFSGAGVDLGVSCS